MNLIENIKKIPHVIWFQYWKYLEKLSKHINPYWNDSVRYYRITGKKMNWRKPQDMSQKLLWLNRYWQPQLKADCADKYRMKEYVSSCGFDDINVPLIGVWDTPDEIDWIKLPNQFVMKTNHGCGTNIICKDKSMLDIDQAKKKLEEWLKIDFSKPYNEVHYSRIKPCIVTEEYLPAVSLYQIDYKFQCINGEPYCILICADRDVNGHAKLYSYNLKWERVVLLNGEENSMQREFPKPINLNRMIECARILAKPFPYVRVDFYEVEGKLYIGELTFTPYGNIMTYYKSEVLEDMGHKLILPNKSYC